MMKRTIFATLLGGSMLLATGCADDNLAKGLVTIGGATMGAAAGMAIAPPGDKTMGALVGAGAGGLLGYMLGGMVGKK